ncbi:hypothetical protein BSKO_12724 [Bryopsis sp. KO-2023]|nr:hypothetical protein BSKO_12724 [Bryopsis sp. KO-2023]
MGLVKSEGDPSASHNCFAHCIGQNYRSTDDGEPGGTAGQPMLNAIESEGLDHVCVMVTRYFGGTKLGTGGLVRAYGGCARTCLKEAKRIFVKPKIHIEMSMTFNLVGQIYPLLEKVGARRFKEDYGKDGLVTLEATVESGKLEKLTQLVKSASSGSINLKKVPTPEAE